MFKRINYIIFLVIFTMVTNTAYGLAPRPADMAELAKFDQEKEKAREVYEQKKVELGEWAVSWWETEDGNWEYLWFDKDNVEFVVLRRGEKIEKRIDLKNVKKIFERKEEGDRNEEESEENEEESEELKADLIKLISEVDYMVIKSYLLVGIPYIYISNYENLGKEVKSRE
ncbi:hypothetical protein KKC59_00345, partial [bacterium]|nr:hypothetical protein [bacterium]